MKELNADGLIGYLDYLVAVDQKILLAGLFDRSAYKTKALGAKFGDSNFRVDYQTFSTKVKDVSYDVSYKGVPLGNGRDRFWYAQAVSGEIGNTYLLTTAEDLEDDLYSYLMKHYKLPLLKTWMKQILEAAEESGTIKYCYKKVMFGSSPKPVLIHGKSIYLRELEIYQVTMSDEQLETIVSMLLRTHQIWITDVPQEPLNFKNFNDYIRHYGSSLVKNLEKEIVPLCELKSKVDTLALKHKRLYPQQAACVNGMLALRKAGIKYGILNEGMGVGKVRRCGVRYDCGWNVA